MPGLRAIITADASQMAREFKQVEGMAVRAGRNIQTGIAGGNGHGGARSGAIRETLVLLREMGRGNWSRVPGSLSILLGQLGLIEAATTAAVGVMGVFASVLTGVGIAAAIVWGRITLLSKALTGLQLPDFNPKYIAKHLQGINQAAEGWKEINREVQKAVEHYNSAAQGAERAAKATKEHFEHLRKMNALEKDPAKKAAGELQINQQERNAELQGKYVEKANLEIEGKEKKRQADAIKVSSKEHDDELIRKTAADAAAAEAFLKEHKTFGTTGDAAKATLTGWFNNQAHYDAMAAGDKKKVQDAQDAIQSHKNAIENAAANDVLRRQKGELTKAAGESLAKAATTGLDISSQANLNAQKNSDDAELTSKRVKAGHGSVSSLQQIGAYTSPAVLLDVNKRMDVKLGLLVKQGESRGGSGGSSNRGGKFGP